MKERDYPEGHPASADYNPDSPEAKAWWEQHEKEKGERAYAPGHPAAEDSPAEKVGTGYRAKLAKDEFGMRPVHVAFRTEDVLVVAHPLNGERQLVNLLMQKFDSKKVTLAGPVKFNSGSAAILTDGVWTIA